MTGSKQVRRWFLRKSSPNPHDTVRCSVVGPIAVQPTDVMSVSDLQREIAVLRDPDELPDSYQIGWNHALAAVAKRLDVERKD